MAEYANRCAMKLDEDGNYFVTHMMAMTKEHLHDKADIACELGWRDREIDKLKVRINNLLSK